ALEHLVPGLNKLERRLAGEKQLQRQTRGLALLTSEQARDAWLTGPVARANGGTAARIAFRLGEMGASAARIEQGLEGIPLGRLAAPFPGTMPAGQAGASVEGPQGCETWTIRADGSERPVAVQITTASERNLAAVPLVLRGQRLSDALLILASLDIC